MQFRLKILKKSDPKMGISVPKFFLIGIRIRVQLPKYRVLKIVRTTPRDPFGTTTRLNLKVYFIKK